jgi:ABC-type Zn uptake system ZnuABC Zn-binding protein ZnuA
MRRSLTAILSSILLCICLPASSWPAPPAPPRILCSTFPVFQIVRNVTRDIEGLQPELMIPASLGCPHDYALTPPDMQKLARAEILVVNGLGLEEFLGQPVAKANPAIRIVDSSAGIQDLLEYEDMEPHAAGADHAKTPHAAHTHPPPGAAANADHAAHAHPGTLNPHLFASPRMTARMAGAIAAALGSLDPARAARYIANAQSYSQRLNALADEALALGRTLVNNRIVTQHGVFDYLARDMGLEVVAVVQAHAGLQPAAAEMLTIIKTVKRRGAGAIFTEPQYPAQIGRAIAREAGIPTAVLDPAANGPDDAPLDYYDIVMRANLRTLAQTLGTH